MVNSLKIGVIGIQGSVAEHIEKMKDAIEEANIKGSIFLIKKKSDLNNLNGLIIPGGECTNIFKIMSYSGIFDLLIDLIKKKNLPVMGTCAGCVLLAKKIKDNTTNIKTLQAIDMEIQRNAFGRQKESFEKKININFLEDRYPAIFIRAPLILKTWGSCEILSKIDDKIIMVRQNKYLAMSFHPELTKNIDIHKYFLNMII